MSGAEHFSLGLIGREAGSGTGSSAGRGAEYIQRLGRYAQEKDHLVHAEEGNLPAWSTDATDYFKAADGYTTRANGRVATPLTFALPVELQQAEAIEVVRGFIAEVVGDERLPYAWAFHEGHDRNPHVHVLFGEAITDDVERPREQWFRRYNSKDPGRGGARKSERFKARSVPRELRNMWERHANVGLERAGVDVRVSLRSYKDRGVELRAQVKQGRDQGSVLSDGRLSMVATAAAQNLRRAAANAETLEQDPEKLLALFRHQQTIGREQLERELEARCLRDPGQPERIRAALDARLTKLGRDRRGNERYATLEQLLAKPELAIEALTLTRSTFTEGDLADLFGADDAGHRALAEALASPLIAHAGAVPLPTPQGRAPLHQERFTSRELLAAEHRIETNAAALRGALGPRLDPAAVDRAIAKLTLDRDGGDEQQRMLHALAGTSNQSSGLVLVQGRPGTGKSYVVKALREAAAGTDTRIIGAAIAGKAAASLGADAGIESFTIAKLLVELELGRLDLRGAILVIDEAGMADTRSLDRVLGAARAAGVGRIALVGDTQQLAPVGPGTPFVRLQEAYGAVILENIKRQNDAWQRDLSMLMSSGAANDMKEAIRAYTQAGRVREHARPDQAYDAVLRSWEASFDASPTSSRLVLAYRQADVAALNSRIRDSLRSRGLLGSDHRFVDASGNEQTFAVGDQILFTRPDAKLDTQNGSVGRVIGIRDGQVHLRLEGGRTLVVDGAKQAGNLSHAFAMTVHRAQGATADHVFVYASTLFTRETAFVALTRHKDSVELHYDGQEFGAKASYRAGILHNAGTPEQRLLDCLSRSDRELSATEAVTQGLTGRVTDAEVHVRAYQRARTPQTREARRRGLEALAQVRMSPEDALSHHAAVQAARVAYVAAEHRAEEVARRNRRRLEALARNVPRRLRFGAQMRFAERFATAEKEAQLTEQAARQAAAHAEETLRHVLSHPEVLASAHDLLRIHEERAEQARKALELIGQLEQTLSPERAVHDYALLMNAKLGAPLYRAPVSADRGADKHLLLLELVKVDDVLLAILQAEDGKRLVHPLSDKAAQWLKPGDHVGFPAEGPWLEKRNQAYAHAQFRMNLAERGLNAQAPLATHQDQLITLEHVGTLPGGLRYGLGRTSDGQERLLDLTHAGHASGLRPGDVLAGRESRDQEGPRRLQWERKSAATDARAIEHARAELASLRNLRPEEFPMVQSESSPSSAELLERRISFVERDLATRQVLAALRAEGLEPRELRPSDHGTSLIYTGARSDGTQHIALLASPDGSTIAMPITGHKVAEDLAPGKVVTLSNDGRRLQLAEARIPASVRSEAERLRAIVEAPRANLEDVLREAPALRGVAERLIETRTQLELADRAGSSVQQLRMARSAHLAAKAAFDAELGRSPNLRAQGEAALTAHASAWREARTELNKLEVQLSRPARRALELRTLHDLNRNRPADVPPARPATSADSNLVWEQLHSEGKHHVAVLRSPAGERVTADVSFNHALRTVVAPGAPIALEQTDRGLRLTVDESRAPTSAIERTVAQLRRERGPARAWMPADQSERFVYLGSRESLALLAADDGFTVVRAGEGRDLSPGQLVKEDARTGRLEQPGRPYLEQLRERSKSLSETVRRGPMTMEEAFARVEATRPAAQARLAAARQLSELERLPGVSTDALETARTELRRADEQLGRASAANPGAHTAAEGTRQVDQQEQHAAKLELLRLEQQLERPTREAAEKLLHYELNRGRAEATPPVRGMREEDRGFAFERLERSGQEVFALLRRDDGTRVTANVTRSPEVRELAQPGMPFSLERQGPTLALTPTHDADRAALAAVRPGLQPSRGDRG